MIKLHKSDECETLLHSTRVRDLEYVIMRLETRKQNIR